MAIVSFLLPKGITGANRAPHDAEASFARFRSACHEAARRANGRAKNVVKAASASGFHQAQLSFDDETWLVVCNAQFGLVGFARLTDQAKLDFTDLPDLARSFKLQGYKVLGTDVLKQPLDTNNCADLDEDELREIDYWKCKTVGEVVFNWFD